LEIRSKTLAYEFSTVVQNAIDEGRDNLSDDEANHLLKISERLVQEYVKELENSLEHQI
jgi:hypothetical protein